MTMTQKLFSFAPNLPNRRTKPTDIATHSYRYFHTYIQKHAHNRYRELAATYMSSLEKPFRFSIFTLDAMDLVKRNTPPMCCNVAHLQHLRRLGRRDPHWKRVALTCTTKTMITSTDDEDDYDDDYEGDNASAKHST